MYVGKNWGTCPQCGATTDRECSMVDSFSLRDSISLCLSKIPVTVKALLSPGGLFIFWSCRGGLILIQAKHFIQMVEVSKASITAIALLSPGGAYLFFWSRRGRLVSNSC